MWTERVCGTCSVGLGVEEGVVPDGDDDGEAVKEDGAEEDERPPFDGTDVGAEVRVDDGAVERGEGEGVDRFGSALVVKRPPPPGYQLELWKQRRLVQLILLKRSPIPLRLSGH